MEDQKEISFKEFEHRVDSDDDEFHFLKPYRHLNESARFAAYLQYYGQDSERIPFIARELERLKKEPVDDNIYFLVMQVEFLSVAYKEAYNTISAHVLTRAREMVAKKLPSAWVAVRTYGWIEKSDLSLLPEFLDATDDVTVWQVVMQCMTRRDLSQQDLTYCRNKCYTYGAKLVDRLGAEFSSADYSASINAVQALMRLLDERALELLRKMPKKHLHGEIANQADRLSETLKGKRMLQYIPVLMEIKRLCQK